MAKQSSLKRNYVMNVILTGSSFIVPIITFRYVSRTLLPPANGKVQLAFSVISYFNMLAQLGIPTYGIRVCAKVRDDRKKLTKTAHELLGISLIMSAVSYILLFAAILFVPKLRAEKLLYLIVSSQILMNAIGMEWLFKALEQYTYITVRSLIFQLIAICAMFLMVKSPADYVLYGGISVLGAALSGIFNFVNARRFIDAKPEGAISLKRHLKPVAIFFAMASATIIYTQLDAVMLGFMKTDADVAYYHAAVKVKGILVGVITSLGAVLLPRVSYYVEKGMTDEFRRLIGKAVNYVFLTAAPLMVYFMIFAGDGILFLSGPAYESAVLPMKIIMPTLLFIGLSNVTGIQILVPTGREKTVLYSEIAGALVDLVLNLLLIPKMASAGAAIGTLAAEAVVLAVQVYALKEEIGAAFRTVRPGKILVSLAAGCAASFWVIFTGLAGFPALLVSAACFFAAYGAVLLLTKEELATEIVFGILAEKLRKLVGKS